ncbi:MAG: ABC transporter ATP-binding protein [Ruminococcaceae bacterium]|nr:ABC transporter ATP-binding protein [Oscillospiraceae bacterium]MBR3595915.1 ABC transporter ATP-binding protein [Clostridia bacterium]
MIEIKNVTKCYGKYKAIEGISFSVKEGSIYGLIGYNGAGKTTLLKTASGVYKANGGEILYDSENIYDNARQKARLFYVPDDIYFKPYASMNKMAAFYNGYYRNFSYDTFRSLTDVFGLDPKKNLNGFSKGMQRQAELVLAMATNPDFLLLDESFDGLDPQKRQIIKNLVKEYVKDRGAHVIISSHNLHDLEDLCDRFGLINGKKLVLDHDLSDVGNDFTKYRMAFAEDDDKFEEDFAMVPLSKFTKDGRLITVTVKGEKEKAEELIRAMNPVYLEQFPMSMEEIFLEEVEGVDYDFSQIFK